MFRTTTILKPLRFALIVLILSASVGTAGAQETPDPGPFPVPESIEPNIEFWLRVFGEWRLDQIAIHDRRHPNVVYAVVPLPGKIEPALSPEQADYIEDLTDRWAEGLKELERKALSGKELTDDEKVWALELATKGGVDAITDAHKWVRTQRGLRERFLRASKSAGVMTPRFATCSVNTGYRKTWPIYRMSNRRSSTPHDRPPAQSARGSSLAAPGGFTCRSARRSTHVWIHWPLRTPPLAT